MAAPTLVGLPPAQEAQRRRIMIVGTALGIGAAVAFFGGLLGVYFAVRQAADTWPAQGVDIPNVEVAVAVVTLIMSSATAQWAVTAIAAGDRRHMHLAIGLTVLLGLAYANALSFSWTRLGATVDSDYGLVMYAVTIGHLLFTAAGIVAMVVVGFRALGGQFSPGNRSMVQAAAMLWHAVVVIGAVVWFCLFFIEGSPI